jgi:hypothetical protein
MVPPTRFPLLALGRSLVGHAPLTRRGSFQSHWSAQVMGKQTKVVLGFGGGGLGPLNLSTCQPMGEANSQGYSTHGRQYSAEQGCSNTVAKGWNKDWGTVHMVLCDQSYPSIFDRTAENRQNAPHCSPLRSHSFKGRGQWARSALVLIEQKRAMVVRSDRNEWSG